MAKVPTTQQGIEVQFRPGVDPFGQNGWRGVNTDADPGSLEPNELQWGENIRLAGKGIINRSGLTNVLDLSSFLPGGGTIASGGGVGGVKEAPCDNPRVRLWFAALGCYGAGVGTGGTTLHLDPTERPPVQTYNNYRRIADSQPALGAYGDWLYVGDKASLRRVNQITSYPNVAVSLITPLNAPSDAILKNFNTPSIVYTISCLQEFDGKLFIGLTDEATPTSSKIVVWDGSGFTDDITGINPPLAFGLWMDKLVCGFDAAAGHIRYRDIGSSPGTWHTVSSGGFGMAGVGGVSSNSMQAKGSILYIAGGGQDIWKLYYVGAVATLSVARNVASAKATDGVTCLTLHNNLLYYGWNRDVGGEWYAMIGRHDSESTGANEWRDSYKELTLNDPSTYPFKRITALKSHRRQLYCGGQVYGIVATKIADVQGDPIEVVTAAGVGSGFNVMGFLRFPPVLS